MIKNKISVIIPYYKKNLFITDTINSILDQTYLNYEIIIVDDENSYESNILLNKLSKLSSKIKIITNRKNIGAGFSRNVALNISNGEFIAFCDSDDLWKRSKLEKQLEFMLINNINFSFTSYEIIDEENKFLDLRYSKSSIKFHDLLKSCDIGLSTVMIKKILFEDIDLRFAKLKTKEDYVLWLKIAKKGIKLCGINEVLTSWRKTNNSLSSSIPQKFVDGYKVYRYYMKFSIIKSLYCLLRLCLHYLNKKI
jgi:teichuronic acid biosynthesis glycosyltransferase TuaG